MKKIVFLTGAGISHESGGKLFRGNGGLWGTYKIEDVCTYTGWEKNPGLVLQFYNERRQESKIALPNAAHLAIAEMAKDPDCEVEVVTQNVDDLHEKAGSDPIHIHGSLFESRSTGNKKLSIHDAIYPCHEDIKLGDLSEDGSQLRPNVVFFGEEVPREKLGRALVLVEEADYLVVVGTSLEVHPAAALVRATKEMCQIYYVDPGDFIIQLPHVKRAFVEHVREKATIGVPRVIEEIKKL
jgi:NAD-dependent deacetylase